MRLSAFLGFDPDKIQELLPLKVERLCAYVIDTVAECD